MPTATSTPQRTPRSLSFWCRAWRRAWCTGRARLTLAAAAALLATLAPAQAQTSAPAQATPAPRPTASAEPTAEPTADTTVDSAAAQPAASASAPAYATRLPPPALLTYGLRSGMISGSGSLRWQPDALAGYTLSLQGTVLGIRALSQGSRGALTAQGLAPEHFADERRGRAAKTVQFDRAAGQIRFSVGVPDQAWRVRVQDRLSWMLQLSAIAAANPALMQPGAEPVAMVVVGARGKTEQWAFEVVAAADVRLPEGQVRGALHLRRLPRDRHDTQVDVWLDPSRHHLPVRLRMADSDRDQAFELRLEAYARL